MRWAVLFRSFFGAFGVLFDGGGTRSFFFFDQAYAKKVKTPGPFSGPFWGPTPPSIGPGSQVGMMHQSDNLFAKT